MANSKVTDKQNLSIHLHKLKELVDELQQTGEYKDYYEEIISALQQSIAEGLSPFTEQSKIQWGDITKLEDIPNMSNAVYKDIKVIYKQLVDLNKFISENFNQLSTEGQKAKKLAQKARTALETLAYYTHGLHDPHAYFAEDFTSMDNIDLSGNLAIEPQAFIDEIEGVATLPYDSGNVSKYEIAQVTLDRSSNGVPGNNYDKNRLRNMSINVIKDSNPDTWFEYEKVVEDEIDRPLRLSILLRLRNQSIVNRISILANNFGTTEWVKIDSITTSVSGTDFVSIKDQIAISDITLTDEENKFNLAPSGSKYEGVARYTFLPRPVYYIRITFLQNKPYPVNTFLGDVLRYAIGIKEIMVEGVKFGETGELVSKSIELGTSIRRIGLVSVQNIVQDKFNIADIDYSLSFDDGVTWNAISSMAELDPYSLDEGEIQKNINGILGLSHEKEKEERLLIINSGENTLQLDKLPTRFRWKLSLKRNEDNFLTHYAVVTGEERRVYSLIDQNAISNDIIELNAKAALRDPVVHIPMVPHELKGYRTIGSVTATSTHPQVLDVSYLFDAVDEDTIRNLMFNDGIRLMVGDIDTKIVPAFYTELIADKTYGPAKHLVRFEVENRRFILGTGQWDTDGDDASDGEKWNRAAYFKNTTEGGYLWPSGAEIKLAIQSEYRATVEQEKPTILRSSHSTPAIKSQTLLINGPIYIEEKFITLPSGLTKYKLENYDDKTARSLSHGSRKRITITRVKNLDEASLRYDATGANNIEMENDYVRLAEEMDTYVFLPRIYENGDAEFNLVEPYPGADQPYRPNSLHKEFYVEKLAVDAIGEELAYTNCSLMLGIEFDKCKWATSNLDNVYFYSIQQDTSLWGSGILYFSKKLPYPVKVCIQIQQYDTIPSQSYDFIVDEAHPEGRYIEIKDESQYYTLSKYILENEKSEISSATLIPYNIEGMGRAGLGSVNPSGITRDSLEISPHYSEYLGIEERFVDGNTEFESLGDNRQGHYSVDYDAGVLYLGEFIPANKYPEGVSLTFKTNFYSILSSFGTAFSEGTGFFGREGKLELSKDNPRSLKFPNGMVEWMQKASYGKVQVSWNENAYADIPPKDIAPYFSPIIKTVALISSIPYEGHIITDEGLINLPMGCTDAEPSPGDSGAFEVNVLSSETFPKVRIQIFGKNMDSTERIFYDILFEGGEREELEGTDLDIDPEGDYIIFTMDGQTLINFIKEGKKSIETTLIIEDVCGRLIQLGQMYPISESDFVAHPVKNEDEEEDLTVTVRPPIQQEMEVEYGNVFGWPEIITPFEEEPDQPEEPIVYYLGAVIEVRVYNPNNNAYKLKVTDITLPNSSTRIQRRSTWDSITRWPSIDGIVYKGEGVFLQEQLIGVIIAGEDNVNERLRVDASIQYYWESHHEGGYRELSPYDHKDYVHVVKEIPFNKIGTGVGSKRFIYGEDNIDDTMKFFKSNYMEHGGRLFELK